MESHRSIASFIMDQGKRLRSQVSQLQDLAISLEISVEDRRKLMAISQEISGTYGQLSDGIMAELLLTTTTKPPTNTETTERIPSKRSRETDASSSFGDSESSDSEVESDASEAHQQGPNLSPPTPDPDQTVRSKSLPVPSPDNTQSHDIDTDRANDPEELLSDHAETPSSPSPSRMTQPSAKRLKSHRSCSSTEELNPHSPSLGNGRSAINEAHCTKNQTPIKHHVQNPTPKDDPKRHRSGDDPAAGVTPHDPLRSTTYVARCDHQPNPRQEPKLSSPARTASREYIDETCSDNEFETNNNLSPCQPRYPAKATTIDIATDEPLSWYREIKPNVGGIQFKSFSMALAYFLGILYGRQNHDSKRRAAWLLMSRDMKEVLKRCDNIHQSIPAAFTELHMYDLAMSLLAEAAKQDTHFQDALSHIPDVSQSIVHLGQDTVFTSGSTDSRRPKVPGRNLFGAFTLSFLRNGAEQPSRAMDLLRIRFPQGATFLVVADSQFRGVAGLGSTTVSIVPGMYAYRSPRREKSAAHIVSENPSIRDYAAIVLVVGTNHVGDKDSNVIFAFETMLQRIRNKTQSPVFIVLPPPQFGSRASIVPATAKAIQEASTTVAKCTLIDPTPLLATAGTQLKASLSTDGYHLSQTGKLRMLNAILMYVPQLRVSLEPAAPFKERNRFN